jgi:hypothetical protein
MKISADLEIIKNIKMINKKYTQNKKIKKISDAELINQFKNELMVPSWIINQKKNKFFNNFLISLAKITRKFI